MDPDVVVIKAESMNDLAAPQLAQPRLNGLLLTVFALAALVLAAVGLYGLMASIVTGQQRELGVRMALGATSDRLRWMILSQAFLLAGAGAVAGLIGVFLGSRLVASMLFDVTPNDPVTLVGVSLVLLSVAGLAAYLPARRATKVDAAVALRAE